jgi:hypothetical protein
MLHEYILAPWGILLGEIFDLEKLSRTCKEKGRWTFFVTSALNHCEGVVFSHGKALGHWPSSKQHLHVIGIISSI